MCMLRMYSAWMRRNVRQTGGGLPEPMPREIRITVTGSIAGLLTHYGEEYFNGLPSYDCDSDPQPPNTANMSSQPPPLSNNGVNMADLYCLSTSTTENETDENVTEISNATIPSGTANEIASPIAANSTSVANVTATPRNNRQSGRQYFAIKRPTLTQFEFTNTITQRQCQSGRQRHCTGFGQQTSCIVAKRDRAKPSNTRNPLNRHQNNLCHAR